MAIRLLCFFCLINCHKLFSQSNTNYYYGKNGKENILIHEGKFFIKFDLNFEESELKKFDIDQDNILHFQKQNTFGALEFLREDVDFSFSIIKGISTELLQENFYVMPYFQTKKGTIIAISHLFRVKLKSEKDYDILSSMAETYGVKIVGKHLYRPMWYTLSCDVDSKGNALELANLF